MIVQTVAVIPARGGSTRLPHKNIRQLFGKPLIVWSIEACLAAEEIDAVFVSSDDERILQIARDSGAETIERPASLADDVTPKIEAIRHTHKWLRSQRQAEPEIIVCGLRRGSHHQGTQQQARGQPTEQNQR